MADDHQERNYTSSFGLIATLLCAVTILFVVFEPQRFIGHQVPSNRLRCKSDLKTVAVALKAYAVDYNGYFPPHSNGKGLKLLCQLGYIDDPSVLSCPSVEKPKETPGCSCSTSSPLPRDEDVSYVFVSGVIESDCGGDSPICWDKPGNHSEYGNVIFVDGHVKGYAGVNWLEQAKGTED